MKNQKIYRGLLLLCLSTALYSKVELTYTTKRVGDQYHADTTRITIHIKGRVEIGKPFPIASLNEEPIHDIVIILEPMVGTIAWKQPAGALYPVETPIVIGLEGGMHGARRLFYELAQDRELYEDIYLSSRANSTNATITYDYGSENIIELENGLYEQQETITIYPLEQSPRRAKKAYNELLTYITQYLPRDIPIVFTKVPVFWGEAITEYIKEIPTRVKDALGYY
jgi:hypothetical protein